MSYVRAAAVALKNKGQRVLSVVHDTGRDGYSVVILESEGKQRVGIRWNGNDEWHGFPQSRGRPTWFELPPELEAVVLDRAQELNGSAQSNLAAGYRAMAADRQREKEAHDWSEGLISDASHPER